MMMTSLFLAFLIGQGADPNVTDMNKRTALHYAADRNDFVLCRLLIEAGVDPTVVDASGQTALVLASNRHAEDIVQLIKSASYVFK